MKELYNSILHSYILDYDIDLESIKREPSKYAPKSISDLAIQVRLNDNGILSHQDVKDYMITGKKSVSEIESGVNEIYFTPKDLNIKTNSNKKLLIAYIGAAYFLFESFKKFQDLKIVIVVNFFISNELSHDLRYYQKSRYNWIREHHLKLPMPNGLLYLEAGQD